MATRSPRLEVPVAYRSYFEQGQSALPGHDSDILRTKREMAFARFHDLGIPTTHDEPWKYTSIEELADWTPTGHRHHGLTEADLEKWLKAFEGSDRFVFIDGHYAPEFSRLITEGADHALTLGEVIRRDAKAAAQLINGDVSNRALTALNASMVSDGLVINVPDGVTIERPVQILSVHTCPDGTMSHERHHFSIGAGAEVHIIENHVFLDGFEGLANHTCHVSMGEGANVTHDRLQLGVDSGQAHSLFEIDAQADVNYQQTNATIGGAKVRNEIYGDLLGSRIELGLAGVYFTRDRQQCDTVIKLDHKAPNCESDQFFKGLAQDHSKASFAGKIHVHQIAQKTNAYQTNNNLMLSPDAEMNSKPELEIYADDVKCSHGATTGEIDQQGMFYSKTRGIDPERARTLLIFAFAGEALERFGHRDALTLASEAMLTRLPGGEALVEMLHAMEMFDEDDAS